MSRTGTSLTTRALNLHGLYLGPEEGLLKAMPANPKGFWEHFRIMRHNERILRALGGNWRQPPAMPSGWETWESLEEERRDARALLEETFAGQELWGWKDPRNSLTLPLWQRLVPDMRYVVCLRNPIDVAASLERRDGIETEDAFALWLTYVASALANTSGRPRLLVSYESWFHDWRTVVGRLTRFAGLSSVADAAEVERQIEDTVTGDLWHHRTTPEEVLADERLPSDVASLYLIVELLREATERAGNATSVVAELTRAADMYARRLLAAQPARATPARG